MERHEFNEAFRRLRAAFVATNISPATMDIYREFLQSCDAQAFTDAINEFISERATFPTVADFRRHGYSERYEEMGE